MIFLNYKTYQSGTGNGAILMAKIVDEVSSQTGIKIIPVVQIGDLKEISQKFSLEIWVQHIDSVEFGAHTGSIVPESVKLDGATGTFLNHSEKRFKNFEDLLKAHIRAKDAGLKTLVFAKDIEELQRISNLKSDFISYEPPELIGSKDKSVASDPEAIVKASEISKKSAIPLIVGAGVHSMSDVKKCIELGSSGIAVASDVMMSDNPKEELLDLVEGFR